MRGQRMVIVTGAGSGIGRAIAGAGIINIACSLARTYGRYNALKNIMAVEATCSNGAVPSVEGGSIE